MHRLSARFLLWLAAATAIPTPMAHAHWNGTVQKTVLVAVAANFASAARELGEAFQTISGCTVRLNTGSTGTMYAQIRNGAPFDVFLAADTLRPARLEREDLIVPGSRFTYARGRLVVWAPNAPDTTTPREYLQAGTYRHLAVAMPETAPYGAAALQVLERIGVHEAVAHRIARGENVSQAYHFVASGNAEIGFVSYSQVLAEPRHAIWLVDEHLYDPIQQQAVLLRRAGRQACATTFFEFLRSAQAGDIIRQSGYGPGDRT